MKRSSINEKYLIYKVKQGKNPDAYGQLYDYYVERIYRFIYFKVRTTEEAEDLTSEVFLKTWQYIITTKKKIDNINALLYRVARNAVIDYYRTNKANQTLTDEDLLLSIHEKRNTVQQIEIGVELEQMRKLINQLKDIYREVLILKHIEEFSITEIAQITGKTKGNVRVLLHRAVQALHELNK